MKLFIEIDLNDSKHCNGCLLLQSQVSNTNIKVWICLLFREIIEQATNPNSNMNISRLYKCINKYGK
jgi:hypothetical protein